MLKLLVKFWNFSKITCVILKDACFSRDGQLIPFSLAYRSLSKILTNELKLELTGGSVTIRPM